MAHLLLGVCKQLHVSALQGASTELGRHGAPPGQAELAVHPQHGKKAPPLLGTAERLEGDAGSMAHIPTAAAVSNHPSLPKVKPQAGTKALVDTLGTLTNVILQADLQLGPQHDESKGGVEMDIVGVVHAVLLAWQDRADGEGKETAMGKRGKGGNALPPQGPGLQDLSQHRQGLLFKGGFILHIENQKSGERFLPNPSGLQGVFLGIALLPPPWSVKNIPMAGQRPTATVMGGVELGESLRAL